VLQGPIPKGRWHLVADGEVLGTSVTQADVRWDVVWRPAAADLGAGTVLASFVHHYARSNTAPFDAIPCEADADGIAAAAQPGDLLVLRISVTAGDTGLDFVPDGDGTNAHGRIPRLDLPPAP
jgi:hypothetical protein